jgi:hydrogenase/urease accessory protein HupE
MLVLAMKPVRIYRSAALHPVCSVHVCIQAWIPVLVLLLSSAAHAHDLYRSESQLQVHGRQVDTTFTFNLLDFPGVDADNDKRVSEREFADALPGVTAAILKDYSLDSSGPPSRIERGDTRLIDDHVLIWKVSYFFPQDVLAITIAANFPDRLGKDHIHLAAVGLGGRIQQTILDNTTRSALVSQTTGTWIQTMGKFVWLGIQHIATGYDHLSFLLTLLVATASLKSLVKVVTSFTLAHSITLALATFSIVVLPSRFTESMIAASIVYVAVENLIHKRAIERYKITFLFGLVHGFGFSNVLREMELPKANLALSLFSFNLGVEIGQVVFVLLVFPAIDDLIKSGWKRLPNGISLAVGLLATYWFIQRAFLG